ncbi:hypothetical protein FQA39_LY13996 [Lamprigera yunnana]|nr:hypothetical protein FQA39_LY13996 [Lamprigera yunnana]
MKYLSLVFIGLFLIVLHAVDGEYNAVEVAKQLDEVKEKVDVMVNNGNIDQQFVDTVCKQLRQFESKIEERRNWIDEKSYALLRKKITDLKDSLRAANENI